MIPQTFINPKRDQWAEIIQRPAVNNEELAGIVTDILKDVKHNGDAAIKKYGLQFDNYCLDYACTRKTNSDTIDHILECGVKPTIVTLMYTHLPENRLMILNKIESVCL